MQVYLRERDPSSEYAVLAVAKDVMFYLLLCEA